MWTPLHHGASVRGLAQGTARGGLSWVSRQITLCEWDVSSSSNAAPPTPTCRICVFDVRKSWTSGDGAKGNHNLGLNFCENAGFCYVQKPDRGKKPQVSVPLSLTPKKAYCLLVRTPRLHPAPSPAASDLIPTFDGHS